MTFAADPALLSTQSSGSSGGGDHGSDNSGEDQSSDEPGEDQRSDDSGEDQSGSDDNQATAACPASPAQGEFVREAKLRTSSAGSTWEKLDLEPAPQG